MKEWKNKRKKYGVYISTFTYVMSNLSRYAQKEDRSLNPSNVYQSHLKMSPSLTSKCFCQEIKRAMPLGDFKVILLLFIS